MNGEAILQEVRRLSGEADWSRYDEINDAYETMCRRAGMWVLSVRDISTLQFRSGITFYTLPMDRIRRLVSVGVKNNEDEQEWHDLDPLADAEFDQKVLANRNADGTDDTDAPGFFRLAGGETSQLEVTPTPDGTYQGRLVYIGNPPAIAKGVTPVLPGNYHRTIAKLAASYVIRQMAGHTEPGLAKARELERLAKESYIHMAFDTAPNLGKMDFPKQRLMRS